MGIVLFFQLTTLQAHSPRFLPSGNFPNFLDLLSLFPLYPPPNPTQSLHPILLALTTSSFNLQFHILPFQAMIQCFNPLNLLILITHQPEKLI